MFPWIVEIFDLSPYHFYKVIEIIVREEDGLSRDVVKHLNHVSSEIIKYLNDKKVHKNTAKVLFMQMAYRKKYKIVKREINWYRLLNPSM